MVYMGPTTVGSWGVGLWWIFVSTPSLSFFSRLESVAIRGMASIKTWRGVLRNPRTLSWMSEILSQAS